MKPESVAAVLSADYDLEDALKSIDLDEWAGLDMNDATEKNLKAKADAEAKRRARTRPGDAYCEEELGKILAIYPELADTVEDSHWSLILTRLMTHTAYKPSSKEILLRPKDFNEDDFTYIALVQKHLSFACFDEAINHISEWADEHPDDLARALREHKREEALQAAAKGSTGDKALSYTSTEVEREGLGQNHEAWGEW